MARLSVMHFAEAMEAKLAKNDAKRGTEGWLQDTYPDLLDRLEEEVQELAEACNGQVPIEKVMEEAADVGNFAMMIFDIARQMKNETRAAIGIPIEEIERREIARGQARVAGKLHDGPMDQ